MGIVSKVISTVRKIDGIYTMMEDAVKKIDEVYIFVEGKRHLVFPESTLIFEKTTAGSYEFTVPEKYNYIIIEIAGGNGCGVAHYHDYWFEEGKGGQGEKIEIKHLEPQNKLITGIVGANGTIPGVGGSGYSNGGNGGKITVSDNTSYGGGGGGSTSVVIDGVVHEASGGGGATNNLYFGKYYHGVGGKGGGSKGGAPGSSVNQQWATTNGGNATGELLNDTSSGYIKIYGIAG
jgi:hypothetical protein